MRQLIKTICFVLVVLGCTSGISVAQHSDIEFSYENNKIAIEAGPEGLVFEADLPTSGVFEQFTTNPGFGSEAAEGLGINPNDEIDYNVLGPLMYHDGSSFAPVPFGAMLTITDNPFGTLVVDDSTSGPVTGPGIIGAADGSGDFHTHVTFLLGPQSLDTPEHGAYGILMDLETDEPGIANSDPFFIVFNFGLDEVVFEGAVEDFATAVVPEPSSIALAAIGCFAIVGVARRRLRRFRE